MPYLSRTDAVWELYLGAEDAELDPDNPENRFGSAWMSTVHGLLDTVEKEPSGALVITATGKYFSNGLEIAEITDPSRIDPYIDLVHGLYARLLSLPVATVAAINGHAFGAGAMLAQCADHRVMRTERGFWSLPEVVLGMPFPVGMTSLLRERIPNATVTEAMTTGRRYGGVEAAEFGIVDQAVGADDLLATARAVAADRVPFAGPNLAVIKKGLRRTLLTDLATPSANGS
ncbi:enoyl-CoA hydratase/isomerase family protein [Williamsia maris]|uniref:Enoyl-CoA hydratase/carnithine racemase n=1 Tax=Williamsia maris TaxID=72806 RepID=A0ABT1H9A4_9NOCA|nr:enoyl-CoA hydratase/isomerase family protein [Williamsia maris]MCP2174320.1 Enoyl-CoA hydratase/carnithine racemase [Williamsia maris]